MCVMADLSQIAWAQSRVGTLSWTKTNTWFANGMNSSRPKYASKMMGASYMFAPFT
jgi:hypothetical protein